MHVDRWVIGINFSQIICTEETAWKKYLRKHGTVHEMIPTRNAIGTNAPGFVVLGQMQLTILKAFAQYTLPVSLHATLNVCCFRCVCSRTACLSEPSSHPSSQQPPHSGRHAQSPAVCISWFMVCTKPTNGILQNREFSWHPENVVH
jgi:hypothetical protein